jgi:uncharacterized protein involved in exopolysaccharide biosynthesis
MSSRDEDMSLRELCSVAWRGRFVIAATGLAFAVAAIAYSLTAQEWYRAEVVLSPAQDQSAMQFGGQLGGIAALAGIGTGGGNVVEAVATLQSRQFARSFIEDRKLLTLLFADDWDQEHGRWIEEDPEEWPDVRDAVEYLQNDLLSVNEDRQTGLVTLAVEWTDPEVAAEWANELALRVNSVLRDRAMRLSTANVAYLQNQLRQANLVEMRDTTSKLLTAELQKLMMARGNEEFAFRIIDAAAVPREPDWPRPALLVVVGAVLGGLVGFLIVFARHAARQPSQ